MTPPANAAVVLTGVIGEINKRADTYEWALDALTLNGSLLAEAQMNPLYARVAALANVNTTDVRSRLGNLEDTAARRRLAGRIIQYLADAFHDKGTGHPGVTFGSGQTAPPRMPQVDDDQRSGRDRRCHALRRGRGKNQGRRQPSRSRPSRGRRPARRQNPRDLAKSSGHRGRPDRSRCIPARCRLAHRGRRHTGGLFHARQV